jgi:hypothetical protein
MRDSLCSIGLDGIRTLEQWWVECLHRKTIAFVFPNLYDGFFKIVLIFFLKRFSNFFDVPKLVACPSYVVFSLSPFTSFLKIHEKIRHAGKINSENFECKTPGNILPYFYNTFVNIIKFFLAFSRTSKKNILH